MKKIQAICPTLCDTLLSELYTQDMDELLQASHGPRPKRKVTYRVPPELATVMSRLADVLGESESVVARRVIYHGLLHELGADPDEVRARFHGRVVTK